MKIRHGRKQEQANNIRTLVNRLSIAERAMLLLCVFAGALQVLARLSFIDPDGMSYLDLSDAVVEHHWSGVINSYWSPLLPLLIGIARLIIRPSPTWEVPVFHLVSFGLYVLTLTSFSRFLHEIRQTLATAPSGTLGRSYRTGWIVFAYAVFLWCHLALIGISWTTPDIGVSLVVIRAATYTLRWRRTRSAVTALMLAVTLGGGYWFKAAMLPVGVVWLVMLWATAGNKRCIKECIASVGVFTVVCGMWVTAVSRHAGHFTTGETSVLNYAWNVNYVQQFLHWQGSSDITEGRPLHPTRLIHQNPRVYEFATPIGGTYPPWYEPSYWYAGLQDRFTVHEQVHALERSALNLTKILVGIRSSRMVLLLLGCLFMLSTGWNKSCFNALSSCWVPSCAAIGMYSFVLVAPRYIAPFILVLFICGTAVLTVMNHNRNLELLLLATTPILLTGICMRSFRDGFISLASATEYRQLHPDRQIASFLLHNGIKPHSSVGAIGYSFYPFWARMARVRVTAEIYDPKRYVIGLRNWEPTRLVSEQQNAEVVKEFLQAGVCAIVAPQYALGEHAVDQGWRRVPDTNVLVYIGPH